MKKCAECSDSVDELFWYAGEYICDNCLTGDQEKKQSIDNTLATRAKTYGEFPMQASIAQGIKHAFQCAPNWDELDDYKKEALEMIAGKIGRILNGDSDYVDSWHDIGGYAKLVEDELCQK